jgi:hypothetical protein
VRGRSQRRNPDAANYGNLDVSNSVPNGVVPDQFDREMMQCPLASLMGWGLENDAAGVNGD